MAKENHSMNIMVFWSIMPDVRCIQQSKNEATESRVAAMVAIRKPIPQTNSQSINIIQLNLFKAIQIACFIQT